MTKQGYAIDLAWFKLLYINMNREPQTNKGDTMKTSKITWSAKNNSSYLNGSRSASSVRAAIRDGRRYIRDELYGQGIITVYEDGQPVREDKINYPIVRL